MNRPLTWQGSDHFLSVFVSFASAIHSTHLLVTSQLQTFGMNKKAFQSNANRPLAHSKGYIVNKFEHVRGGQNPVQGPPPEQTDRQTRLKTLSSYIRWRAVLSSKDNLCTMS